MQFLLSFTAATTAFVFISLLFLYFLWFLLKLTKKNNGAPPEAAGAWPIIGHLHILAASDLPHITFGRMADKYGPIFTINIGVNKTLVVSDSKIAKECLATNDKVFASRPKLIATELMAYNYAMFGRSPYGSYWRNIRKIVMLELLSNSRLENIRQIRVSEIEVSINDLNKIWKKNENCSCTIKMDMKEWFENIILKILVRMLFGYQWYSLKKEARFRYQKAMSKVIELLGVFVISDAIPFLRWLDLGGYEKSMKKTAKEMDEILESWLQDHKRKRISGEVKDEDQGFMGRMVNILEDASAEDLGGFDADTVNKATCLNLILAGSDTTIKTLTWALSLLLNNRHVLKKAQHELDLHVGRERQVVDSDMKNLVYLQAIIKETLRLYPPTPLVPPHESMEDCVLGGYRVNKRTRLLINIWKIHRDPKVWPDPDEFRPDRFLTSHNDVDVWGQHFELIPFSSGRRLCPGIAFGLQIVQLTLASFIHGFKIATPTDEPIDMSESFGFTNGKNTPLEVLLTPRLSSNLYKQVIY